jgi:hypothetical protein
MLPNEDLKGGTKDEMLIFDAPFNGVNALILGYKPRKKCLEHLHFIFCSSFQHLRLGVTWSTRLIKHSLVRHTPTTCHLMATSTIEHF